MIPRLVVPDAEATVTFLREVFGAQGELARGRPTELLIGDSAVMVSEVGERPAHTAFLYVYVEDVDVAYATAIRRGATSIEEPRDTPYGEKRAMFSDPAGNAYQVASPPPGRASAAPSTPT